MCRNIRTLFNFDPPATEIEVKEASLQFVRKLSGFTKPSASNQEAFELAVKEVAAAAETLIRSMTTVAVPKNRVAETARAKARAAVRYGKGPAATA